MSTIAAALAQRSLRQKIRSMHRWAVRAAGKLEVPVLLLVMGPDKQPVIYPLTEHEHFPHDDLVELVAVVLEELRAGRYDDRAVLKE